MYIVQYYELGNISYKYEIQIYHQKFPNLQDSKEALRKFINKFMETSTLMDVKKPKETIKMKYLRLVTI